MSKKPVVFDLEQDAAAPSVSEAPPVPEIVEGKDVLQAEALKAETAASSSHLWQWFLALVLALVGAWISVAAWEFATGLIASFPILGWGFSVGFGVALLMALVLVLRELAAISRLKRADGLRLGAAEAQTDLGKAQAYVGAVQGFLGGRSDLAWQIDRFREQQANVLDADALIQLAEEELMAPLDARALREIEASARQVATVTALVPLALADVAVALVTSVRMIRKVAEIYGGRSGLFSSWRLFRAVVTHLAATGAVAVGDDMLEPLLGGSVLSKLSRRFGEGLVNGALSARVGIAAMEVCRPMPFSLRHRPSARKVVQRALAGLFGKSKGETS